jgi:hypothetical protein
MEILYAHVTERIFLSRNAIKWLNPPTSSTWHLRTPSAKITSLKVSLWIFTWSWLFTEGSITPNKGPPHSYIDARNLKTKKLAAYLKILDADRRRRRPIQRILLVEESLSCWVHTGECTTSLFLRSLSTVARHSNSILIICWSLSWSMTTNANPLISIWFYNCYNKDIKLQKYTDNTSTYIFSVLYLYQQLNY